MLNPAVIYTRVSTQDQADSRLGLESQLALCKAFALRNDYEVIFNTISDEGVSASVPLLQRPSGKALAIIAGMDGGPITILALCQDRLFRSVSDMLATCEVLAEAHVNVVTVDEGAIDLEDDDRWLSAMMRAVFAELERRRGRKRTTRGLAALKARGGRCGEPPYGWRKTEVRATFEQDPIEQETIREIIQRSADGMSSREIATLLNRGNIRTRDGKQWSHTQVLRILGRAESEGESE